MIKLATVSPCYNEEEVLKHSVERLTALFERMISEGLISQDSMMVFVNDGSRDKTWQIIEELHRENPFVKGINLARNVGHQNAIMAGMMTAKDWADAIVTIDADLQDDIECIPQMVKLFEEGNEIIYGVKTSRKADPLMKRMTAQAFYKLQSSMGVESVYNHADFRLMSKRSLEMLASYKEHNLYLRGLIPHIGLQTTTVDDVISERYAGSSKYTLSKMLGSFQYQAHVCHLLSWISLSLDQFAYWSLCTTRFNCAYSRSRMGFSHTQCMVGWRIHTDINGGHWCLYR